MPFRIDVPTPNGRPHRAPTQEYQNYLDDVARYGNIFGPYTGVKYTEANLFISVSRETIGWFIAAPLEEDYTSQQWRNEVYGTAADAHREMGCVGYYRGTNSLHIRRQHQTAEEAAHNHNHYRFETEVTPELFAQHIRNFVKYDKASTHNDSSLPGSSKFLTAEAADIIIETFTECYKEEKRTGLDKEYATDPYYQYTREDLLELEEGRKIEGSCRDMSKGREHTMSGLRYDRAEERQHTDTPASVLESRRIYAERTKLLEGIKVKRAAFAQEYYGGKFGDIYGSLPVIPQTDVNGDKVTVSTSEKTAFAKETIATLKKSSLAGFFNKKQPEPVVPPVTSQSVSSQESSAAFTTATVSALRKSKLAGFFNRPGATLDDVRTDVFQSTVEELAKEDDTNVQLPALESSDDDSHTNTGTKDLTEAVAVYS